MTMAERGGRLEDIHGGPPPETLLRQELDKAKQRQLSGRVVLEVIFREGQQRGTLTRVETNFPASR